MALCICHQIITHLIGALSILQIYLSNSFLNPAHLMTHLTTKYESEKQGDGELRVTEIYDEQKVWICWAP